MAAPILVPCPWHQQTLAQLLDQHARHRLPHSLLLSGPEGVGKRRLALSLAQVLLCEQPQGGVPCAQCEGCQLSSAETHPDLFMLRPEKRKSSDKMSNVISVDQVRDLVVFTNRTAKYSGYRVVLIEPAESLNRNAQNALLKTLEEPGRDTLLILISHQPSQLLATIRSRCQQRHLPLPSPEQAMSWLQPQVGKQADALLANAQGAPLRALQLEQAPWFAERTALLEALVEVAERRQTVAQAAPLLARHDPRELASVVYDWLSRSLNLHYTDNSSADAALVPLLRRLGRAVPPRRLLGTAQRVLEGRRALMAGSNPNAQLLYEQWLLVLRGL